MHQEKLLITGANGFIGSNICNFFDEKFQIICFSRIPPKSNYLWYEFKNTDFNNIEYIFKTHKPDYIIHTAAIAHKNKQNLNQKNIDKVIDINVNYTKSLAKLCKIYNTKRFIYLSSISVYSINNGENFLNENSEINPKNIYAISKYKSEKIILENLTNSNTKFTIFRLPIVYGIRCPGNLLRLIKLVEYNLFLPLGNFTKKRSMLSINNLTSAIDISIRSENTYNKVYLLSDKELISTRELILLIKKVKNKKLLLFNLPKKVLRFLKSFPIFAEKIQKLENNIILNINLFKKDANWEPPYKQNEELIKTFKGE